MKKLLSLLILSAVLLTGCNSGKNDSDSSGAETGSATSVTEETTSSTSVAEETSSSIMTTAKSTTTVTSASDTTGSESNTETGTSSNTSKPYTIKETERETVNVVQGNNEIGQDEQVQNGEKPSSNVRENDEGEIIVVVPETSESTTGETTEPSDQNDDFQIVTEAPIELPFIPAG